MHTPWVLRYSWGGVGWGCVHVPSTCTRWWCTRHECYGIHGVMWGGAVFMFLQLAHAGDAHAMSATVLMGWCGAGLCSCLLQLAHGGDAHAMSATVSMGWCGVGLCSCSFNLHTPWVLRYSWVGVGRGCVHVPSTCTRWWCTRHECYGTHGVVWVGLCSCAFNLHTPWMLRWVWCGVGLCSCSFNLHTRGMGLGLGWGGDVNIQLKSHTYVMRRSTPTLT